VETWCKFDEIFVEFGENFMNIPKLVNKPGEIQKSGENHVKFIY